MAGLTFAGFTPKTLEEIKAELEDAFRAAFGESIDVSAESVFGQIIGIQSERYAELWELAEALHSEFNPDNATGARLDGLSALTGTVREPATKSNTTITATGDNGTVLPIGRVVSVEITGIRFATDAAGTIAAATPWVIATNYVAGQRITNGASPARVYECTTGGTSAGVGTGPSGTGSAIVDNTVTWKHLGEGAGVVDVLASAEDTGPLIAAAGTLNTIETPVSGWKGVTNLADAELGADVEGDPSLRLRREDEIRGPAKAANPAVRAAILKLPDVETCTVFGNRTNSVNGDGLPPHSVECLILGGDEDEIRKAIFENVAEGIETYGGVSGTHTDSEGNNHTIEFSRPTEYEIWIDVYVTKDDLEFPVDGDDQIKAAIVAFGALSKTGKNVVSSALKAQAFKIAGVLDVTACYIRTAPAPFSEVTIAMGLRDLARYDTARINVYLASGTP